MKNNFSSLLSKYLKSYLITEMNASKNTIRSYTKTFKLLIDYLVNIKNITIYNINFETLTRDIIIDFLNYLENDKNNSINTRNQRLGAIKSFYQYCLTETIENIDNSKQILNIKAKKSLKKEIQYLTLEEYQIILNSIDLNTLNSKRNYLIITLLYEGALRADELIHIKISDIHFANKTILINGKGNKQRYIPITDNAINLISNYIEINNIKDGYLFNRNHKVYNDTFIRDIIKSICKKVNLNFKVTPHTFRHSRAIHLLENGIPLIYIRDLLGHSSIQTTEHYAKVSVKFKNEALEKANKALEQSDIPDWRHDKELLDQLLNL